MRVSVVTTLFHSSDYIDEFFKRIVKVVSSVTSDFEILLVDDGSPDQSLSIAKTLLKKKYRVKIIQLSRNFGHHKALMKGLTHAQGDFVFMIDCDLEEPPELFKPLYEKLRSASKENPIDVIQAVQNSRKGGVFEKLGGHIFYQLFNSMSSVRIPENSMMARLVTRRFLKALLQHEEREYFLSGLVSLTGFRQEIFIAEKSFKGKTTYSFSRRVLSALTAITSFSDKPLFFIFYSGIVLSSIAFLGIIALVISFSFFGVRYLTGWASIVLISCLLGGFGIASIGVVGLYLGRVFIEVKKRPSIVMDIFSNY
jgi:putative glycosyltransferase